MGFYYKNDHGIALAAGAGNLENVVEPLQVEALGILYAMLYNSEIAILIEFDLSKIDPFCSRVKQKKLIT